MKKIRVLIICMIMMCIRISFAEEEYYIKDFIESKLFADQFGCIQYDSANGDYTVATYEEITKEFPGAVDRCYEYAPKIRAILYRIPSKIGESSVYWSNSKLLYSYWKAVDGVFIVIWEGNNSISNVGLVAGRSFYFTSLKELAPLQLEAQINYENEILDYQKNLVKKSPVYLSNNTIDVIIEDMIPTQVYCVAYNENRGIYLKSYFLWKGRHIRVSDCTFLIEDEMEELVKYINKEYEKLIKNQ